MPRSTDVAFSFALGILLLWAPSPAGAAALLPEGYKVFQSVALKRDAHGLDGALQVLEDARVTAEVRESLWATSTDPTVALDKDDPAAKRFAEEKIRPARVRLVDSADRVLDERTFEVPLAELERERLAAGPRQPTFFVTVDETTGMGHSASPATLLATVADGKLRWETVVRAGTTREIILGRGLEGDWRLDRQKGGPTDILAFSCLCADDANAETYYRRYRRGAAGWGLKERKERRAWNTDKGFPPPGKFPPR